MGQAHHAPLAGKDSTLILIGNHDISPAAGRAHAIQEFDTLQVPYIKVLQKPEFLTPKELWDIPIQIIAMPWITRSSLMANIGETDLAKAYDGSERNI